MNKETNKGQREKGALEMGGLKKEERGGTQDQSYQSNEAKWKCMDFPIPEDVTVLIL